MRAIRAGVLLAASTMAAVAALAAEQTTTNQTTTDQGVTAFLQGRYSVAIRLLEQAHDERGRAFYGLSLAGANHCREALPVLTASFSTSELKRTAGVAAIRCLAAEHRTAEAQALADRLEKQFPSDADILYVSAKVQMKAFNDATLAMFERTPSSFRVHQLSAEVFEIENRFAEAVAEYRKAIEANPKAPDLHFRLGRALLLGSQDSKTLVEAAKEFEAELQISPEDSASEFQLGQIAETRGDPPAARDHWVRALRYSPDFVGALIGLGKLESRAGDQAHGIALLEHAVASDNSNISAHYALMRAYKDAGRTAQAAAEKKILDKSQKSPDGEFNDFLKRLGEKPPPQE